MTQSVSESHTIQKERKERGPQRAGSSVRYRILDSECITIGAAFFFLFFFFAWISNKMKDIQNAFSVFTTVLLIPCSLKTQCFHSRFFKGCKCNPDFFFFSFKRLQCTITFYEGKQRVNYKMQKGKKETNYSVSIVQR